MKDLPLTHSNQDFPGTLNPQSCQGFYPGFSYLVHTTYLSYLLYTRLQITTGYLSLCAIKILPLNLSLLTVNTNTAGNQYFFPPSTRGILQVQVQDIKPNNFPFCTYLTPWPETVLIFETLWVVSYPPNHPPHLCIIDFCRHSQGVYHKQELQARIQLPKNTCIDG